MLKTDGGLLNCWRQTMRDPSRMEDTMQGWSEWLDEMKKKDEKEKMEEMHQHKVAQMIKSAEGSAGLLYKISKGTAWRGGAQIMKKDERMCIGSVAKMCSMWREWLGK